MKIKILMFSTVLSLLAMSCSKEDNSDVIDKQYFKADEAVVNAKLDIMNDDLSQLVEENLTTDDGITGKSTQTAQTFSPACATISRVPAFGTTPTVGSLITKTIDFGTVGCALPNGNILKGKIVITFIYNPSATTHTINYQFVNFYHNAILVNGNKTFTRVMSTATAASTSHPIVTMNMDMTATFPDGRIFTRVGTRVREIIEGYGNALLSDNVYKVTGSWTTTYPNASVQTSTITTPIIVKFSCYPQFSILSKGVITFTRDNKTATLDYGNGTCDNLAVFTINGLTFNIVLNN
ncbi:hypothetical protein [Flavobacterium sp.]|uniref:hypothetical protein n=1 Tax=Flavobacterium sp. TaxID=239 RepID=UPI003753485C